MAERCGNYVINLTSNPKIISSAAVVGKTEGEGPLAKEFDFCYSDDGIKQSSWEKAEAMLIKDAVTRAIVKSGKNSGDIDLIISGDLLNQCTASTYGVRELNIPFAGVFGACSTMAYSMALAAVLVDSGALRCAVAATSSHFCSAEKQFRYPIEYGGQRSPTCQRTVTGGASCVIGHGDMKTAIGRVIFGKVVDLGVADAMNMGAAMAPAAAETIADFLKDTATAPENYDMILTGDLGFVGSSLLISFLKERENIDISAVHADCGMMIFDREGQDVHAGGSGCACSGTVVCSKIMRMLNEGELKNVLFVGTGALMSPLISLQGETIPGIAHAVQLISQ